MQSDGHLEFHTRAEQSLARLKDERVRTVYGLAIASLDPQRLDSAQDEFEAMSRDGTVKDALKVADVPRQLEIASPLAVFGGFADAGPFNVLGLGRSATHLLCCAKALGHHVTVAAPATPAHDRLLALYGLDHHVQKRGSDLPAGTFDVIAAGNLVHVSDESWAAFFRPVLPIMSDDGRIVLTVLRRPMPERGFDPEVVLSMFERAGALVSRTHFSVKLNKQQIEGLISIPPHEAKPSVVEEEVPVPQQAPAIDAAAHGSPAMQASPMQASSTPSGKPVQARTVAILVGSAVVVAAAILWMVAHNYF